MKALIYRDFSDSFEEKIINAQGKIKDVFAQYSSDKYAFLVDGQKKDKNYFIKESDTVVIRAIPFVTGLTIASLVIAGVSAVVGGVVAYRAKKQAQDAQEEAKKAQQALSNAGSSFEKSPMLQGASNTVATGKTQPFVMGRRLFTPYLLTSEWDDLKGAIWQDEVKAPQVFSAQVTLNKTCTKMGGFSSGYNYVYSDVYSFKFLEDWNGLLQVKAKTSNSSFTICELNQKRKKGDEVSFSIIGSNQFPYLWINGQEKHFVISVPPFTVGVWSVSQTINTTFIKKDEAHYHKDNQQSVYRVLQQGFASQKIEEIKADDETLIKFPDPVKNLFTNVSTGLFKNSLIEVKQDGEPFETEKLNYKMDVQNINDTLHLKDDGDYKDLEYVLPVATKSIYIPLEFPGGLYTTLNDGRRAERTIKTQVFYSLDSGKTYELLPSQWGKDNDGVLKDKSRQDIYFILNHTFEDSEVLNAVKTSTPIKIKITCLSNQSPLSACDSMQIIKIRSTLIDEFKGRKDNIITYSPLLSGKIDKQSVKIGLKLLTNQSNKDKAKKIQVVACGCARIWDSQSRQWSSSKEITRNPAAWLLEVLTSDTHPASKISQDKLDLESFGDFYEYCQFNSYNIDYVVTQGDTKENLLKKILECGNAYLYRSIYGKITVAIDDVKDNAIAILNQQNIISFTAEKDLTRLMDGYRVTFPVCDIWKEDTKTFMADGSNYEDHSEAVNLEEITIDTFTANANNKDFNQIYKFIRRKINAQKLRVHKYSIEIGKEGYYFPLFSRIKIQHPALYAGLGSATIKNVISENNKIVALEVFGAVEYSNENRYGAVIQCVTSQYSRLLEKEYIATSNGLNKVIYFVNPIDINADTIPQIDNILSFGLLDKDGSFKTITNDMTITKIEPTANGFRLSGLDYSDKLFDYGSIPAYETNLTEPRGLNSEKRLSNDDLINSSEEVKNTLEKIVSNQILNNSTTPPADVVSCKGLAEKDGINFSAVAGGYSIYDNVKQFLFELSKDAGSSWQKVDGSYYSFDRNFDFYPEKSAFINYRVRAKTLNSYGQLSENWTEGEITPSTNYKTWILKPPAISAKAYEGKIEISLNDEVNSNVWGFKNYSLKTSSDKGQLKKNDEWNYTLLIAGLNLEKSDIEQINFIASVSTEADKKESLCKANTSDYLTYKPTVPDVSLSVSGRNVSMNFSHPAFYEFTGYTIQISKDGINWHSYGEDDTQKDNANAWQGEKDSETQIQGNYKAFFLSLDGEDKTDESGNKRPVPADTVYYFRARTKGYDKKISSSWAKKITVIATATSAYDIALSAVHTAQLADGAITQEKIKANSVTSEKIYVENLASIKAVLGNVSAGSIASGVKADKETPDPENSQLYLNSEKDREEFFIGNVVKKDANESEDSHEFLHFKRYQAHNDIKTSFILKISNFIVTAVASIIKGLFKIQAKGENTDFIIANPTNKRQENVDAKTMQINGDLYTTGTIISDSGITSRQPMLAKQLRVLDGIKSDGLIETKRIECYGKTTTQELSVINKINCSNGDADISSLETEKIIVRKKNYPKSSITLYGEMSVSEELRVRNIVVQNVVSIGGKRAVTGTITSDSTNGTILNLYL
ncbi:phage tail protein [Treponema pectinovorum]|uniref:hypothetical protein n=1 Tax=Treponema pectinovorum TaxID=164 RepID=UPI0011CA912D|nr:hypothetical protein [Treponema pectinovorum]